MNSNAFHNIANIAIAVLAGLTAILMATGCVNTAAGGIDCAASWIDPKMSAILIMGLSGLKVVVNFVRDGLGGMFKPQPPVQ